MNEKQVKKLFQGITGIDDDIIEEAQTAPPVKKAPIRRRWGAVAACLCVALLAGALVWRAAAPRDLPYEYTKPVAGADDESDTDDETVSDTGGTQIPAEMSGDTLPGEITPTLRVGDTLYQWTGMSKQVFMSDGVFTIYGDSSTYLPEGFQPLGDISSITLETPAESLQLQAGFEASGTVFVSDEHPAVAYVLMTTDWFEDYYIRFVSDALGGNELLCWKGRMYRLSFDFDVCGVLEELPNGCELIGNLHFVGEDAVPTGDLETNHRSDNYSKPFEGREVYAIPGDDSTLYVYEHHYWRGGDYPAWRECHLWER